MKEQTTPEAMIEIIKILKKFKFSEGFGILKALELQLELRYKQLCRVNEFERFWSIKIEDGEKMDKTE